MLKRLCNSVVGKGCSIPHHFKKKYGISLTHHLYWQHPPFILSIYNSIISLSLSLSQSLSVSVSLCLCLSLSLSLSLCLSLSPSLSLYLSLSLSLSISISISLYPSLSESNPLCNTFCSQKITNTNISYITALKKN